MSIVQKLTEGMVNRNMQQEGAALLRKWSQTGLLEGLSGEEQKASMARLLENQARELLRESNTMAGGDVEGFAAVAFPIVRRVFAVLIANDLVSVQPMSLPSGLIFFLDFKFSDTNPANGRLGQNGESIYGQGVLASTVTGGVQLNSATLDQQPYAFGSAYSSPTASIANDTSNSLTTKSITVSIVQSADGDPIDGNDAKSLIGEELTDAELKFDADLLSTLPGTYVIKLSVPVAHLEAAAGFPATGTKELNKDHLSQIVLPLSSSDANSVTLTQVRRLTSLNAADKTKVDLVYYSDKQLNAAAAGSNLYVSASVSGQASFPIKDQFTKGANHDLVAIRGTAAWGL